MIRVHDAVIYKLSVFTRRLLPLLCDPPHTV